MGILDNIVNKAEELTGIGTGKSKILGAMSGLLGSGQTGGLTGLVEKFKQNGLGNVVSSWIGHGQNETVTGDQIKQVLGADKIKEFAEKSGLPVEEAPNKIAEILPGVVDKLTPEGKIPEGDIFSKGLDYLKSIF